MMDARTCASLIALASLSTNLAQAEPQACFTMPAQSVNTLISYANQDERGACITIKDALPYRIQLIYRAVPINSANEVPSLSFTAGKHWSDRQSFAESPIIFITDEIGNIDKLTMRLYPSEKNLPQHIWVTSSLIPGEDILLMTLSMWTSRAEDPKAPFSL